MINKNFIEGVNIIAKYLKDRTDEYDVAVGHDQLWFGAYNFVINKNDKKRLCEIGWREDEVHWSCSL